MQVLTKVPPGNSYQAFRISARGRPEPKVRQLNSTREFRRDVAGNSFHRYSEEFRRGSRVTRVSSSLGEFSFHFALGSQLKDRNK